MPRLIKADCFRIALWFVGEEHFHPSERMVIQMPFSENAIRAALAELKKLTAQNAGNTDDSIWDRMKSGLVRALSAIRRFCLPELKTGRTRSLLRDIAVLRDCASLHDSLSGFLQVPDVFRAGKAWRALQESLVQRSPVHYDERVRKILAKIGNATGVLRAWYDLQDHLKRPPCERGTLPLVWSLDQKLLSRLKRAIEVYRQRAGHLLPPEECSFLEEATEALDAIDLPRPHWDNLRGTVACCLDMLNATKPPRHSKLGRIRGLLEHATAHFGSFAVPQTYAEITTSFDILETIQADLGEYLVRASVTCSPAVRAQLADCREIASQFLCSTLKISSVTAIEDSLNEARATAPDRVQPEVCELVEELYQAYQGLVAACRKQWEQRAWTAADSVRRLITQIRESTDDDELGRLCDSIDYILDPLAQCRRLYRRLKQLDPPPRAPTFASLTECSDNLARALWERTDAKAARVACRIEELLPLALDQGPLEYLLLALAEFREAASRNVLDALRRHGDAICDWSTVYRPAFDAAQFSPPTGDARSEVREALDKLRPAEIANLLKTTNPERPFPEHTLRLMEGLAEYQAGISALGIFLSEYSKVVGFLESGHDPAMGPDEFQRFRDWLSRQQFRFPPPRFAPLPYADFAAWLMALPVSQQADVLRVMFIGPWSDVVDTRVKELMSEKPSIFTAAADQQPNEPAKRRALLFLIQALATYRPFGPIRQLWETICPPYYRRILPPGLSILDHMLQAIEKSIGAWESARAAGAPGLPATFPIELEVAAAWKFLLGHERLAKQIAEGKLRRRSRRVLAAQVLLESVFAGPATDILEALCQDPYRELEDSLRRLVPRIERFYGKKRRAAWASLLIKNVMEDVNPAAENGQKKAMSDAEKREKRAESRRKHSRVKAEEEILVRKIEDMLDRLHSALTDSGKDDPPLWAQYGVLKKTLSIYRWRERMISALRCAKREHSPGLPPSETEVLEGRIEKTYARLYGLANQIASSYPYFADQVRGSGLSTLAECLQKAGRATVDLVYGFVRGRRPRRPGDDKQGGDLDSRPRGLQYLILRKWMDDDDDLLDELLDPPR